jgi:hypothetical protein
MRPREINNVDFFIKWFNKAHQLDFQIDNSYQDENSPVDVMVRSSMTNRVLKFQNVAYRQGTIYGVGTSNISGLRPVFVMGRQLSKEEKRQGIIECIESKKNKYPIDLVRQLILLIEITIPSLSPKEIEGLLKSEIKKDFGFLAIYFVKLPVKLGGDKYDRDGFVYSFKSLAV